MKTLFAIIGGIHVFLLVLSLLGALDYHLCVKDAGKCHMTKEQP